MTGRCRTMLLTLAVVLLALPVGPGPAAGRSTVGAVRAVAQTPAEPPLADAPPRMPRAEPPPGVPVGPGIPSAPVVDPPTPRVSVKVRVAATASAAKELEYRLVVENGGQGAAHRVYVRAAVPSNADFVRADPEPDKREPELRWEIGTLPGAGKKEILLVVRPTGGGDVECTARVGFEHGETVRSRLGKADLRLRLSAPERAAVNDLRPVTLEITNLGKVPAAHVVLTAQVPNELGVSRPDPPEVEGKPFTWELGSIEPGRSRLVRFDVRARDTGSFILKADARADGGASGQASASVLVGEPKLRLEMTGPERRLPGGTATYRLTVGNPGTMPAGNVVVEDVVPEPVHTVSAVPTPQALPYNSLDAKERQVKGVRLRWPVGTLAPGEKRTLTLTVRFPASGEQFANRATARADRDLVSEAEVVTALEGAANLKAEFDRGEFVLESGKKATYTLRVGNRGSAAATNVALTLTVPEGLRIVEGAGPGPDGGVQSGNVIRYSPVAKLEPNGEQRYTVTVEALPPKAPRVQLRFRVEVTADQLERGKPLLTEEVVTVTAPSPLTMPPP